MNKDVFELTPEQEFRLMSIRTSARDATQEQLAELIVQITQQLMIKENIIKDLLKSSAAQ